MVDLAPVLAGLLKGIARVETSFPASTSRFPVITLSELGSTSVYAPGGRDRLVSVDWQVDVWDNGKTAEKCVKLAGQVTDTLQAAGFGRYFGQRIRDAAAQRYCMRFRGTLDENTMRLYRS